MHLTVPLRWCWIVNFRVRFSYDLFRIACDAAAGSSLLSTHTHTKTLSEVFSNEMEYAIARFRACSPHVAVCVTER